MKQRKVAMVGGRMYTTSFAYRLSFREALRALFGAEISTTVRLHVQPGASDIPTQVIKTVGHAQPATRLPWRRAPEKAAA
jgi:hypothetical protein